MTFRLHKAMHGEIHKLYGAQQIINGVFTDLMIQTVKTNEHFLYIYNRQVRESKLIRGACRSCAFRAEFACYN